MSRYTVRDFRLDFPDDDVCLNTVFEERYGDLEACPSCGVIDAKFYRVSGRKCYACEWCGYQLHPLSQTIFHKSSTSLWSWFYAIYLFSVSKNGVSAKELERHLGVTYKTAYRMAKQIRTLMGSSEIKLSGIVEADETFIGGRPDRRRKPAPKAVVVGAVERGGEVVAEVKSGANRYTVLPFLEHHIHFDSSLVTDDSTIYRNVKKDYRRHNVIKHSKKQYVDGEVYTNTIEGFWSQMKRSIDGTYHRVSPKYLQLYVNEFVFRYNLRGAVVYPVLLELAATRVKSKS